MAYLGASPSKFAMQCPLRSHPKAGLRKDLLPGPVTGGGRIAFPVGCRTESLGSLVVGGWSPPSTSCPTGLSIGQLATWRLAATSAGERGHASRNGIQSL